MKNLLQNLSVGTRLAGGFGIVLFLMVLVSLAGIDRMRAIQASAQQIVEKNYARVREVNTMRDAVRFQSRAIRDVVLQQDLSFMRKEVALIKEARDRFEQAFERLETMVVAEEIKSLLEELRVAEEAVQPLFSEILDLSLSDEHEQAAELIRSRLRDAQARVLESLQRMLEELEKRAEGAAAEAAEAADSGELLVTGISVAALLIGALAAFAITRSIVGPLGDAARVASEIAEGNLGVQVPGPPTRDETGRMLGAMQSMVTNLRAMFADVVAAADDISAAARSVRSVAEATNDGVRRQESEISHMVTAVTEMSASAQSVSESATRAAEAAHQARSESDSGSGLVQETARSIRELADEVEQAGGAINALQAETAGIEVVLDVIKGVAEQTNLLALNAAIEAARAGDQGRGFAVVADEVRTLASRTHTSTQEIATMIERLQNGASNAVGVMSRSQEHARHSVVHAERASASLQEIARAVGTISEMNTQIATAANEQTAVSEEITRSIVGVRDVAESSATGSQETASAGVKLEELSDRLHRATQMFHT